MGIVDTSVIISFLRGFDPVARRLAALIEDNRVILSSVTVFELFVGVEVGTRAEAAVRELTSVLPVLPLDRDAAHKAAEVERDLRRSREVIGTRDTFIAGLALSNNLPVYTQDVRHFRRVRGLTVIDLSQE